MAGMDIYLQIIWNSVVTAALLCLLAVPFTVIYSVTRILYIAQGAIALASGYFFYFALLHGFGWLGAAVFSVVATVVLAVGLNALVYERLRARRPLTGTAGMLSSVAVLLVVQNLLLAWWTSKTVIIHGFLDGPAFTFGPLIVTPLAVTTLFTSVVIIAALMAMMRFTKFGRSIRAVSDQEEMAGVVGVNTKRTRMLVVAFFSVVTAVGGILAALAYNLYPPLAVGYAIDAFSISILGGLGNIGGALVASFLYMTLTNLGGFWWTAGIKTLFIFGTVFAFLLLRPQGIFGKKRR